MRASIVIAPCPTAGRNSSASSSAVALPAKPRRFRPARDRKSTRLNSSHGYISYAVFCLKKKNHDALFARVPDGFVLDGQIVIATPHGLDVEVLQLPIPLASPRAAKPAIETPASFIALAA